MFDPVPWFVAGGDHGPEVARLLAYFATAGNAGVTNGTDCKVTQSTVPDGNVVVGVGGVSIPNMKPGGAAQSYLGRNPSAQSVALTATSSSGSRSDLIIVRVEDPQYAGTSIPADPAVGPYTFVRVVENVPVGTKRVQEIAGHETDSAITLARVTRPASTSTVLNSHITDLRPVAQPKTAHETRISNPTVVDIQDSTASTGEEFPNGASWSINIPTWATAVRVIGTWSQIKTPGAACAGWLWVALGSIATQQVRYDTASVGGTARSTFVCADEIPVPASLRGTTVTMTLRGQKTSGAAGVEIQGDTGSSTSVLLDFLEIPA